MQKIIIVIFAGALVLSWLWFWTAQSQPESLTATSRPSTVSDTVTVWVPQLLGSPDESYYYALADLWNTIEPNIHLKMSVIAHSGYDSKLRVAIASGQPPDVCFGGLQTLESLQYTGKASDLSVPIPAKYFPQERLNEMGDIVRRSVMHDGRPVIFPIWRYSYGGILLANNEMLKAAGYDDEQIRKKGWTIDEFRDACKRMTRDTNGDGKPDTFGFGAALVHLQHLFMDEFGPGIWGRRIAANGFFAYDGSSKRWVVDPALTERQIELTFALFNDLINVDKSWDPATLGMPFDEIIDDITIHRTLGMTFGEVPWVPRLRYDIWQANVNMGNRQPRPPELTAIWMPTLRAGDRPAPRGGVMGFSVMKQTPYKGDVHTDHAMRVAVFLTHPVHLARSQITQFRHLPPDPKAFNAIYPELVHGDDKWVRFYNDVMDSDIPVISDFSKLDEATRAEGEVLNAKFSHWLAQQGMDYLQQVIYQKLTPAEGAKRFFHDLKGLE